MLMLLDERTDTDLPCLDKRLLHSTPPIQLHKRWVIRRMMARGGLAGERRWLWLWRCVDAEFVKARKWQRGLIGYGS
jgi:hypothetical protein